jgi:hypothetical protein
MQPARNGTWFSGCMDETLNAPALAFFFFSFASKCSVRSMVRGANDVSGPQNANSVESHDCLCVGFIFIMVSVEKNQAEQASKKKRVTFSFCTDKSDSPSEVRIQSQSEVSTRLSKCIDKDSEYDNKYWSLPASSHKRQEKSESVKVSRKNCDVKKTLVRNVEQGLGQHCAISRGRLYPTIPLNIVHDKPGSDVKKSSYKSKFAAPELYTTLCIAKEIQDTTRSDAKRPSGIGINPLAKQVLDVKVLVFP